MADKAKGWSAEMDRKIAAMKRDPEGYLAQTRAGSREHGKSRDSTGPRQKSPA